MKLNLKLQLGEALEVTPPKEYRLVWDGTAYVAIPVDSKKAVEPNLTAKIQEVNQNVKRKK